MLTLALRVDDLSKAPAAIRLDFIFPASFASLGPARKYVDAPGLAPKECRAQCQRGSFSRPSTKA